MACSGTGRDFGRGSEMEGGREPEGKFCAWRLPHRTSVVGREGLLKVQGTSKRPFPGCENASGKLRQKWEATAGTKFTKPGNDLLEVPCI